VTPDRNSEETLESEIPQRPQAWTQKEEEPGAFPEALPVHVPSSPILEELCHYIEFTEEDLDLLREVWPRLAPTIDEMASLFLSSVQKSPKAHRILNRERLRPSHLKQILVDWAQSFFTADRDHGYEVLRSRIGARHLGLGLEQHHLMGAVGVLRGLLVAKVGMLLKAPFDRERTLKALHRALDLEISLITEYYALCRYAAEQRVVRTEEQYRSLFEAVADGAFVVNIGGRYTLCNQVFLDILGRTKEEVIGHHLIEVFPSPAAERVLELHDQVTATGCPLNAQINVDLADRNLWLSVSYSPIHSHSGEVVAITGIARDVTEERQRSALQAHHHKMTSLGFLASGIAHEVSNPLASIASMASDLEETSSDQRTKTLLQSIHSCTKRAARSLRQMLSFARPTTREPELTSLNAVVERTVELASFDPRARCFEMASEMEPGLPWILGHPEDLSQVLLNLLLNAFDAMEGRTGRIEVRTGHADGWVHLSVSDCGPGIHPEQAVRIFEPFFSTKTSTRGTGLGLFVSRQIVRDHRGTLTLQSVPGEGATFTIRLPIPPPPSDSEGP